MTTLEALRIYGPATVRQVASHVGLTICDTREEIAQLEQAGAVEARGESRFDLTDKGIKAFKAAQAKKAKIVIPPVALRRELPPRELGDRLAAVFWRRRR